MFVVRLIGVLAPVALNGFFAATEFSLVAVRLSRIRQLVPQTLSLARPERIALLVAVPFRWFLNTFRLAINVLDGASSAIVKALGVSVAPTHGVAHSTEELQIQIQQARERGLLAPGE